MITKDFKDKKGIHRRALVPDEYSDPAKGIIVSVYLDEELRKRGWSNDNISKLYTELRQRGLITPADFLKPQAQQLLRASLLAVSQMDVQTLQAIALEQTQDGTRSHST